MTEIPWKDGYSGTADTLVFSLLADLLPSVDSIAAWQEEILAHCVRRPTTLVARKFAREMRGVVQPFRGSREVLYVVSDNTPAIWTYVHCRAGDAPTISGLINDRRLPIALALRKDERLTRNWEAVGARELNEIYSLKLKHCHILPCNPRGVCVDSEAELQRRSIRLLSPLNHFLFPSPRRFVMTSISGAKSSSGDLGEQPAIIQIVRWYLFTIHMMKHQALVERALRAMGDLEGIPTIRPASPRIEIIPVESLRRADEAKDRKLAIVRDRLGGGAGPLLGDISEVGTKLDGLIEHVDDDGRQADSKPTLNEQTDAHNSQKIIRARGASVYEWRLSWRFSKSTEARPVGLYRLNLEALREAGVVAIEGDSFRLKVFHDADGFFLRLSGSMPKIKIAPPISDVEYFEENDTAA